MERIEDLGKHEKRVKTLFQLKADMETNKCGIEMHNFLFEKICKTIPYHHVGLLGRGTSLNSFGKGDVLK